MHNSLVLRAQHKHTHTQTHTYIHTHTITYTKPCFCFRRRGDIGVSCCGTRTDVLELWRVADVAVEPFYGIKCKNAYVNKHDGLQPHILASPRFALSGMA